MGHGHVAYGYASTGTSNQYPYIYIAKQTEYSGLAYLTSMTYCKDHNTSGASITAHNK
jgi:hypothetical protein